MFSQQMDRVRRSTILAFLGICGAVFLFPAIMNMTADYYLSHPLVIPFGIRLLMMLGAFVRLFRLLIILISGIALSAVLLSRN